MIVSRQSAEAQALASLVRLRVTSGRWPGHGVRVSSRRSLDLPQCPPAPNMVGLHLAEDRSRHRESIMDKLLVRRVELRAHRMHDLMQRIGVDPAALVRAESGDAYSRARSLCHFCGTSDQCLRWLDQTPLSDTRPTFCPNLTLFEACRRTTVAAASGDNIQE